MIHGAALVTGCVVLNNGGYGIYVHPTGVVTGNLVERNGTDALDHGVYLRQGLLSGNFIYHNAGLGAELVNGGYQGNVFEGNNSDGAQVAGGHNIGNNLCGAVPRP